MSGDDFCHHNWREEVLSIRLGTSQDRYYILKGTGWPQDKKKMTAILKVRTLYLRGRLPEGAGENNPEEGGGSYGYVACNERAAYV